MARNVPAVASTSKWVGRAGKRQIIGGFRDHAHGFAVGAGRIEYGKREARIGDPLQNRLQPRQPRGFKLLDQNLMRRVGGSTALAPARQGSLRIEVERDYPLARARRRNGERGRECGLPRSAFLRDECNRAHRESRYTRPDTVTESARCKVTTTFGCGREKHGADFLLKRIGFSAVH